MLGGSDSDPSNYALLCPQCHVDAPDILDGKAFWRWVEHGSVVVEMWDSFRSSALLEATAIKGEDWVVAQFDNMYRMAIFDATGLHEGINPATRSWAMYSAARIVLAMAAPTPATQW